MLNPALFLHTLLAILLVSILSLRVAVVGAGLEILLLTTFLSFLDAQSDRDPTSSLPPYTPFSSSSAPQLAGSRRTSDRPSLTTNESAGAGEVAPPLPPKPDRLVEKEREEREMLEEFRDFEEPVRRSSNPPAKI